MDFSKHEHESGLTEYTMNPDGSERETKDVFSIAFASRLRVFFPKYWIKQEVFTDGKKYV